MYSEKTYFCYHLVVELTKQIFAFCFWMQEQSKSLSRTALQIRQPRSSKRYVAMFGDFATVLNIQLDFTRSFEIGSHLR